MPIADIADRNCVLCLWAIDSLLPNIVAVGEGYGFTYKTVAFYWTKTRRIGSTRGADLKTMDERIFPMGTGYWTRANPEMCLLFTRGQPRRHCASVRKLIVAPRREHSRKPDETYERIERLCGDVPRIELFARGPARPGWTVWGNEAQPSTEETNHGLHSPDRRRPLAGETTSA